jgi:hypothetical protein
MGWQPRRFGPVHMINSCANPRDAAIYRFPVSQKYLFGLPPQVGTVFRRIEVVVL